MTKRAVWVIRDEHGREFEGAFQEIARRIAEGEFSDTTVVRRADEDEFQSLDRIVGLERAVEKMRAATTEFRCPSIAAPDASTTRKTHRGAVAVQQSNTRLSGSAFSFRSLAILFIALCGSGLLIWMQQRAWARFPSSAPTALLEREYHVPLLGSCSFAEFWMVVLDLPLIGLAIILMISSRSGNE